MKPIRMLYILLIGMISLTAMASTPSPEQKQKPTIEKSFEPFILVANVQNGVSFISIETTSIKSNLDAFKNASVSFVIKERVVEQLATIEDVGWRFENESISDTNYKEKLTANKSLLFKYHNQSLFKYPRSNC